jgi:hypothetical protein
MKQNKVKMNEKSRLKRTVDKLKYGLVLQSIRNKLARIGLEFTPFYWVREGLNPLEAPDIKGSISDFKVEFLKEQDMKYIGENARGYSEEEFLSWIKAGKKCLALRNKDNDIAVFMWINLNRCSFKPIDIPLNENEAYLTDMYTMETYRGRNLAPYLRFKSYEVLNKIGRNKLYSVSEFFNSSAIKYKLKLNAQNIKLVLYIRLFNKFKWSHTLKHYSKA